MSELWEVVITYQTESRAMSTAKRLHNEGYLSAKVRKVNPDAHPVADPEQE